MFFVLFLFCKKKEVEARGLKNRNNKLYIGADGKMRNKKTNKSSSDMHSQEKHTCTHRYRREENRNHHERLRGRDEQ